MFAKKAILNFIAPVTAIFFIESAIQVALPVIPLLPLFSESLVEGGINALIPKMVMNASSHVLFSGIGASFFAGLSKEGMKENISFLLSPSKWNAEYLFEGKEPAPVEQKPVPENEIKTSKDKDINTQPVDANSFRETFTQKDADKMVKEWVDKGWTGINLDGSLPQKEKLWFAIQVINWKKERLFEEKKSKGKIWFGDKYVPITAANFFPSQEDEIYQKWKQIEASLEEVYPSSIKASPIEQPLSSISAKALAEVSHRRLVLPPKLR